MCLEDDDGPGGTLEVAHIDYPPTGPGTERIDAHNLTNSDVVLLCHQHHRQLDKATYQGRYVNVDAMRQSVIGNIEELRRQVLGAGDDDDE